MNQTIGIVFTATGQATVIEAIKGIQSALTTLQQSTSKIDSMLNLGNGLEKAATHMDKFASAVTRASQAAPGINNLAQAMNAAASAAERLSAATGRIQATPIGGVGQRALPSGTAPIQQLPSGSSAPVAMVQAGRNTYYNPAQHRFLTQSGTSPSMIFGNVKARPSGYQDEPIRMIPTGNNSWSVPHLLTGGPGGPKKPGGGSVFDRGGNYGGRNHPGPGGSTGMGWGRMGAAYTGYMALSKMGGEISDTTKNIYLGGSRDKINHEMQGLIAIDLDKRERDVIETAGQQFISKNPNFSMPQYLGASSQAGSAISKDILGIRGNVGITEAGLKLSALGKLQPEKSVDLITDRMLAERNRMSTSQQQKNFQPGSDYLNRRPEELLGLYNAVIREAKVWGPDLQEYQKSALALETKLNWTPERSLAHETVMRNQGFRSSTIGMAMKNFASEQGRQLARLQMLNERDKNGKYVFNPLDVTKAKYKKHAFNLMEENARRQAQDPYYMAQTFVENVEAGKQRVSDPLGVVGANKHHIAQYEAMAQEGYLPQVKHFEDIYRKEREGGATKANLQMEEIAKNATSEWVKLEKAISLASESAGKFAGNVGLIGQGIESLNQYGKHYQGKATVDSSIGELEKLDPRGQKIKDPIARKQMIQKHLLDMDAAGISKEQQWQYLKMTEEKNWETPLKPTEFGPGGKMLGKAWDAATKYEGLAKNWNINPFDDGQGPIIARPRFPMSDNDRMNLELDAAKGQPSSQAPNSMGGSGTGVTLDASGFDKAVDKFSGVIGRIGNLGGLPQNEPAKKNGSTDK